MTAETQTVKERPVLISATKLWDTALSNFDLLSGCAWVSEKVLDDLKREDSISWNKFFRFYLGEQILKAFVGPRPG
jgi:hypothetical protein